MWAMNLIDHHIKFIQVLPLHNKSDDEVIHVLKQYCFTFGFPKKIICDNGKEFKNANMTAFCQENGIKQLHDSLRTPTTRGLVERANRSWKEDMRTLILSESSKAMQSLCEYTSEAAYVKNISHHRAMKMSPYEAVFGFKPHREKLEHTTDTEVNVQEAADETSEHEVDLEERWRKRRKIEQNQQKYNEKMVEQTHKNNNARKKKFKYEIYRRYDMIAIKINRVDKTFPFPSKHAPE